MSHKSKGAASNCTYQMAPFKGILCLVFIKFYVFALLNKQANLIFKEPDADFVLCLWFACAFEQ